MKTQSHQGTPRTSLPCCLPRWPCWEEAARRSLSPPWPQAQARPAGPYHELSGGEQAQAAPDGEGVAAGAWRWRLLRWLRGRWGRWHRHRRVGEPFHLVRRLHHYRVGETCGRWDAQAAERGCCPHTGWPLPAALPRLPLIQCGISRCGSTSRSHPRLARAIFTYLRQKELSVGGQIISLLFLQ